MNQENENQAMHHHWGRLGRSVLNGVMGDYLERENNPLAIRMGFYHQFNRLVLDDKLALQLDTPLSNKIVVFVHGLTNLESVWDYHRLNDRSEESLVDNYIDSYFEYKGAEPSESYGSKLQQDFGYTPFFLRYNTGLSLEKNGREFAKQLSHLHEIYPIKVDELMLVGFSMGGLLLRHAQHCAIQTQMPWLDVLSKCMYIGSPHEGSALEKIGHFSGEVVRHIPRESINHWADWIDQRSEGIQDLKQGLTLINAEKKRTNVCESFAESARHYFISGSVGSGGSGLISRAMGDSLVRQNSANTTSAPVHSQNAHFEGLTHTPLANSDRVYQQISAWVDEDEQGYRHKMGGKSLDVMNYAPLRKPYFPEGDPYDPSSQALLAGTIDLVASAYDKTLEAVETVHYSIAEEPFYAMQKLPLLSQVAKPVERTHREILDLIYRSLRFGGKIVHRAAKKIAPDDSAIAKLV